MHTITRPQTGAAVGALCALLIAASGFPAQAGAAKRFPLRVSPATPLASAPLKVSWRAPSASNVRAVYSLEVSLDAGPTSAGSRSCFTSGSRLVRRSWKRGTTVRYIVTPGEGLDRLTRWWCPGPSTVRLVALVAGVKRTVASARFAMTDDPANPVPGQYRATVRALEGSKLTVSVPGRPDRTSAIAGSLQGFVGPPVRADGGLTLRLGGSDGLTITDLARDSSCAASDRVYPAPLSLTSPGNESSTQAATLDVPPSGTARLTAALSDDPVVLTGCLGPAALPGEREFTMTALVGDAGRDRIPLSATFPRILLMDNSYATITIDLIVSVSVVSCPARVNGHQLC